MWKKNVGRSSRYVIAQLGGGSTDPDYKTSEKHRPGNSSMPDHKWKPRSKRNRQKTPEW